MLGVGSLPAPEGERQKRGTPVASIISIHSFRGGTGKSNTTANLAAILAEQGRRVAVIDTDIQSPGIHILFGLVGDEISASLNDFLWHGRAIEEAARDVTPSGAAPAGGKLFLIPSSTKPGEIARVLREGYDAQRLTQGLRQLVEELRLDVLMIDTHPGLNEETLLSLVISHALLIVMRPDQQDYEGTGIAVKVAQGLQVPRMLLVVNKTPPALDPAAVKMKVEEAYGCEVAAVLPHSDEMMTLASEGIFALRYPDNPMTDLYRQVAAALVPA
ncbi:MAG: Cobyrinic acid ac-diamide synthase [Thermomicrobiales bacterium]|jgi:MinD-like ATPase involved in chromosome partitioning or flagellar assembly|nr:Cobyrinic acid ac-diamide synthase [Thermomicrobiales bacterium]MDF3041780.1 Cobyrinic acid ac-diamide synthase [Thermomicrobiales bacterium]